MRNLLSLLALFAAPSLFAADAPKINVTETDEYVQVETDALQARIRKKGYVSGTAQGTLIDRKTGAKDLGFGLHIQD